MTNPPAILGWDIGGVNTKVARLKPGPGNPVCRSVSLPYEAAVAWLLRQSREAAA